jgi:N6-adenosine-specific RNA methylase IME4/ParB-like chromosome segregation protein Spo0J
MMPDTELAALASDIQANGLRQSIVMFENKILDGRNRYFACGMVDIEPHFTEYNGDDPVAFVISANMVRRHLNESQRALCAARLAKMRQGERTDLASIGARSQSQAAKLLNISRRSVQRAKSVLSSGVTELVEAVDAGKMPVSVAASVIKMPKDAQCEVSKRVLAGDKPTDAIREVRRSVIKANLDEKAAREVTEPTGLYDVIVIDPPWPVQKIEREERPNQAELDYPVMTIDEITALKIPCADDCHVWLWTTQKFLPVAFSILRSWGLTYVCTFVWHKPGGFQPFDLPQYNNEFAIYARKGTPKFVDTKDFKTCFEARRGSHSEKPDLFYDVVRRVTAGRRIDMFSRRAIDGFDAWGNEV